MPPDFAKFAELHETWIQNLRDFLNTEVELGITFASLAKYYRKSGDAEHYETSKHNALTALAAVNHFKDRLPRDLKAELDTRRSELAQLISTL